MNIIQMTENFKNKTEHEKRWLFGDKSPVYYVKNKKELKFLIENGFDINEKDKTGKNALFYVQTKSIANELIKLGIEIIPEDDEGNNIFFYCPKGMISFFKNLGIDINKQNKKGETALFKANVVITKELIKNDINIHIKDNIGNSALFFGTVNKKRELLKNGIDINCVNNKGCNALFSCSDLDETRYLVESGINVHQRCLLGYNALKALQPINAIEYLLKNTDINPNDFIEYKNKGSLIFGMHPEKIELFLKYGVDVNIENSQGKNALFYVPTEAAAEVLIKHGIKVNHFLEKRKKPFNNPNIEKLIKELSAKEQQIDLEKLLNSNNSSVKKKRI